ncbi:tRNA (guanine(26)-N(2))-dimethyltransferase-like [Anneissia japonica]|uniref:tRNA (guanine(26)-N(2))-dimethyltransferase-like n=1 Tax=Anneissia japonica TaxID=1529436 RepID=UPI001425BB91|nr:tRNA (guanine(26)-N(2))-dimethyltransferase-like [Anneissia japonica]
MSAEVATGSNASSEGYTIVKEGTSEIIFPNSNEVFYNPVQEFNRDISSAVISLFAKQVLKKKGIEVCLTRKEQNRNTTSNLEGEELSQVYPGEKCEEGITILEGLSASGLRSIRYAKEIAGVKRIVANDFSRAAVESIERNIKHNKIGDIVEASLSDAALLMYSCRSKPEYDVVDLDPYGSPAMFLDAGVQAVKDGGLLCVTCTDLAVLSGNHGETCFSKYGAMSLHAKFGPEMALRIVLQAIETSANRYHRHIVPLLSVQVDFYLRVFLRVYTSQATAKRSASKRALVYHCTGCDSFHLQGLGKAISREKKEPRFTPATGPPCGQTCADCGSNFQVGGPMWRDPIHDVDFVQELLGTLEMVPTEKYKRFKKMKGTLTVITEELQDCPLYYTLSRLCNIIHCTCPSNVKFRSALLSAGHRVSITHTSAEAIKTDAPSSVIWDIMRSWEKLNPVKRTRLSEDSVAYKLLQKEPVIAASFEPRQDANPRSRQQKMSRFPLNPEPNWGPKSRAKKRKQKDEPRQESQSDNTDEEQDKKRIKQDEIIESPKEAKAEEDINGGT